MSMANTVNTAITGMQTIKSATDDMIALAPADQQPFLRAQQKADQEAKITKLITDLMDKLFKSGDAVLNNLK
ncbi:hypothetical protein [Pyxidicoccus xibeiensis]|uniref:hypothetical protein n=1 Tax=Pyxidicoccus xibeiensis TaxID=2906759 RepID=UPI0020A7D1CD|nr:hypothetical protein [Pyxidicoccus xibeiensis]MCP3141409.1 hypothetical protein [Pyxidicoccus xibeiensis]